MHVRAEQKDRRGGVAVQVDADQVARHRDHAEEVILEPPSEEADRNLLARVGLVDALEGLRVPGPLETEDARAKTTVVEPVDGLRRHQGALRLGRQRVGIRQKIRAEHHQIEPGDDNAAGHRQAVLPEAPPHELPLRGDEDALLVRGGRARQRSGIGCDGHHVSSSLMRGSIQTSRMSEIRVPITVITPRSSTMVPARNMSCEMSALSSSGPTVGGPSTSETMMLPETMYGSV